MKIKTPINLKKNKFCDVKELQINKILKKKLELKGNCEILSCRIKIGPNSGYLKLNDKLYLIWDQWCHYERLATKLNFFVENKQIIEILDKKVDYSSCRKDYDFSNVDFELDLKTIYYIGDNLEFVEGC